MTTLLNIPNKLKSHFTLTVDKNNTWLNWLNEELSYINGAVYLNTVKPVLNKQTLKEILFGNNDSSTSVCKIIVKGEPFIASQYNNVITTLNDTIISPTVTSLSNGIQLELNNTYNGTVRVNIPPYNGSSNIYTGFITEFKVRNQTVTISNWNQTNNNVSFDVVVTNPVNNQSVNAYRLDRNYAERGTFFSNLNNNGMASFTIGLNEDITYIRVRLEPVKYNNIFYMGNEMTREI